MDHPDDNEQQEFNLPQQFQSVRGASARSSRQRQRHPGGYHHTSSATSAQSQYSQPATDLSRRRYQQQEAPDTTAASTASNLPVSSMGGASTGPVPAGPGVMFGHDAGYHSQLHSNVPQYTPSSSAYPMMQQQHFPHGQAGYQQPRYHQAQQQHYQQQQQQMKMPQQPMAVMEQPPQPYFQPMSGRLPRDRPLMKLSVSLIDTYKHINKVYYEERDARRAAKAAQRPPGQQQGINNHGWDDENYDYIITPGEILNDRYIIKERIGKGSFGQVIRALDKVTNEEVAVKIIKSKKPFLMQAKTEIELLSNLVEKSDQNNIVRLIQHFLFRNHQCLVFEMLSLNLYELLKNTQFCGVSLNLIRKFAKQILKALSFLARPDIDIIHCDLKPENILLRHPKRSGIKVIDFGSSCRSNRRMYSYIQSRFYRSPEVMLGLPYTVSIDMWSLGCILVEMHTGEPLFSGSDQFDQIQKIVKILGMIPTSLIERSSDQHRLQFFARGTKPDEAWILKRSSSSTASSSAQRGSSQQRASVIPSRDPIASLAEVIGAETSRKKKYPTNEPGHSARNYDLFVDLIYRMLAFEPQRRIKPDEALRHPFILEGEHSHSSGTHHQTRKHGTQEDSATGSLMRGVGVSSTASSSLLSQQQGASQYQSILYRQSEPTTSKDQRPSKSISGSVPSHRHQKEGGTKAS